jgi:hypothetical protein
MKAIGFRAEKDGINWAVVEGTKKGPVLTEHDYIKAPNINSEAASLSYFRERLLAVIQQYQPGVAFVRYPEPFRQKSKITSVDARLRVEGVILEVLYTSGIEVLTGAKVSMGSKLKSNDPTAYLKATELRGLVFPNRDANSREAIMAAVSALGE